MKNSVKIAILTATVLTAGGTIGFGARANKQTNAAEPRSEVVIVNETDEVNRHLGSIETTKVYLVTGAECPASEEEETMEITPTESETETVTETTTTPAPTTEPKTEPPTLPFLTVSNMTAEADSVSSIKVTWDAEKDRDYEIGWFTYAPYSENIEILLPENGVCYLTGLRMDSEYEITVTPVLKEDEEANITPETLTVRTPSVEVIQEFDYEDGWTNCFAGERASGLTRMPSSGAIYGSQVDSVTGTGIRRFENGDYCCAMGTHYGYCNDRFIVELDNGIQFTTRICDSKGAADVQDEWGYGKYHWFGGEGAGKCIIEFIYDDYNLPSCVAFAGSWGGYNWNGLNLGANIKSIQKINY